jgi:hypothetical protein
MARKKLEKKKHKALGIGAIAEPGFGALYVRSAWMEKMNALGKRKQTQMKKNQSKQRFRPRTR